MKLKSLFLIACLILLPICLYPALSFQNLGNMTWYPGFGYNSMDPTDYYVSFVFDIFNSENKAKDYTVFFDEGLNSPGGQGDYSRRAKSGVNDFLNYQLFKIETSNTGYILKDYSVAYAFENIIGSKKKGDKIPALSSISTSYYLTIPNGQNVSAGTYTDTIEMKLHKKKFDKLTTENDQLQNTISITLTIEVQAASSILLKSANSPMLDGTLNFGTPSPLQSLTFDLIVISNANFSVHVTSTHGSQMENSDHPSAATVIPYELQFQLIGNPYGDWTTLPQGTPQEIYDQGSPTAPDGDDFRTNIRLNNTVDPTQLMGGNYQDTLTFEAVERI